MALTARQLRFVDEYCVDQNGAQAATRAGYSVGSAKVTACRLLTNVHLRGAVAARQSALAAELQVTRRNVLEGLLEAEGLARERRDPMGMIAALREQAKLLGFYAPEVKRVELSESGAALAARMHQMSDEELLAVAAGAVAVGM